MEAKKKGAKIITFDPRLSNTAAKSDVWLPTWPGSETTVLLAIARELVASKRYDRRFVERWVDWPSFLGAIGGLTDDPAVQAALPPTGIEPTMDHFEAVFEALYAGFSFERAAADAQVDVERIREAAEAIAAAGDRLAAHNWRSASIGNRGGWQVVRALFLINVLTGSVGTTGGTSANSWNKFVPKPFSQPPPGETWNDLHFPDEWPLAHYEMSFLLPHMLLEGRGDIDVYFTRVYNPLWTNPDGFLWHKVLRDQALMKLHVALTPTWNESAWFADYVLPMGHAGERHDLMSQETHSGRWIGFRQPVRRVAMERAGQTVEFTHEANPGEVWEEAEFWVELSGRMDPDGSLGVRQWFESPHRPGKLINQDEYWSHVFEKSVPGLPEAAAAENLSPLAYMRKYGAFEIDSDIVQPFEDEVEHASVDSAGRALDAEGTVVGVVVDGVARKGFGTPSRRLEMFSATLSDWGWKEREYVIPWPLPSHVGPPEVDREAGQMVLLPNFRLPTMIHTRSANAKWLVEISHNNPAWLHPQDAARIGVRTGDLVRIDTETGWFVDQVWVTEGIKPGVVAVSHHLGRWRLDSAQGGNQAASSLVRLEDEGSGHMALHIESMAGAFESSDPDTSRIWWKNVGVHQNLTHGVHPDPISGAHCWLQRATSVRRAAPEERYGEVHVDTNASMEVYRAWKAGTRPASTSSPDGTRRPYWFKRPLKPTRVAYQLPKSDG
jgi:anaerobic selenocysteine-containing dehydrogenase